jgi:hypothetical protein
MTDLRTAVDALLPCTAYANGRCLDVDGVTPSWRPCNACAVLDLIPEGSVLVTEAEVYTAANDAMRDAAATGNEPLTWSNGVGVGVEAMLAAILARIREGQR